MQRNLELWQFYGFVFTGILGTVLHFFYDWTKGSVIAAPFSAVNESTWEHMKILFFPMFIFSIIESFLFSGYYESFWCVKVIGILTGLMLIPVIFYTYLGIFGKSSAWFNILIFFISVAAAFFVEAILLKNNVCCNSKIISFAFLCILAFSFAVFTFKTPEIPLFQDPIDGTYGMRK